MSKTKDRRRDGRAVGRGAGAQFSLAGSSNTSSANKANKDIVDPEEREERESASSESKSDSDDSESDFDEWGSAEGDTRRNLNGLEAEVTNEAITEENTGENTVSAERNTSAKKEELDIPGTIRMLQKQIENQRVNRSAMVKLDENPKFTGSIHGLNGFLDVGSDSLFTEGTCTLSTTYWKYTMTAFS